MASEAQQRRVSAASLEDLMDSSFSHFDEADLESEEAKLETLFDTPYRDPVSERFAQRQLEDRVEHDKFVKEWELTEAKESNRAKRANYRILLYSALVGAAVPLGVSALIFTGHVKSTDAHKSQSLTASVGLVTSILGFLAGYNAP